MSLIQLIHLSRASRPMSLSALVGLMVQCRERNRIEGITGVLMYHDQQFVQLLEGDTQVVAEVYDTICRDARNTRSRVVFEGATPGRDFPEWSMAFLAPDVIGLARLPGYSPFLDAQFHDPAFTEHPSAARGLLWRLRKDLLRQQPVR